MKLFDIIRRWSKLRISQRLYSVFVVAFIGVFLIFLVNLASTAAIARINKEISGNYEDRLAVEKFSKAFETANVLAEYMQRLLQTGNLSVRDDLAMDMAIVRVDDACKDVEPVIRRGALKMISSYQDAVEAVHEAAERWDRIHDLGALLKLTSSVTLAKSLSEQLVETLGRRLEERTGQAQRQLGMIRGISTVVAALILIALAVLLLPTLKELRGMFGPLRQASNQALDGARNASEYTAQIDESIEQLLQVMSAVGQGIVDATNNAQDTSTQTTRIMAEVIGATESARDLSDEAASICNHLDANQGHLSKQMAEIQELSAGIAQALGRIDKNAELADQLTAQVGSLEGVLTNVEQALMMVDDVNDQVDLLALNASVEAARAGERGTGFNIVAERLRKLSDQTKGFTSQIMSSVAAIQMASRESSTALREVIQNVRGSVTEVVRVNDEFEKLQALLGTLYKANEGLIQAANLQRERVKLIHRNTEEIRHAVENISDQTLQVSGAMQELSAESEEIIGQVQNIGQNVQETKEVVERQVELASMAKGNADRF